MTATVHPVWQFWQANFAIYAEDRNGNLVSVTRNMDGSLTVDYSTIVADTDHADPLLIYCYAQSGSIQATLEHDRRPVTGRPFKLIVNRQYEYSAEIESLYISKNDEVNLTYIFNRDVRVRVVMTCTEEEDVPVAAASRADVHTLLRAVGASFHITGRDNDSLTLACSFDAEQFV